MRRLLLLVGPLKLNNNRGSQLKPLKASIINRQHAALGAVLKSFTCFRRGLVQNIKKNKKNNPLKQYVTVNKNYTVH